MLKNGNKNQRIAERLDSEKRTFKTVEHAYRNMSDVLFGVAGRHLVLADRAIDVVHNVFEKVLEYKLRKPKAKITSYLLYKKLLILCSKENRKVSPERPMTEYIEQTQGE